MLNQTDIIQRIEQVLDQRMRRRKRFWLHILAGLAFFILILVVSGNFYVGETWVSIAQFLALIYILSLLLHTILNLPEEARDRYLLRVLERQLDGEKTQNEADLPVLSEKVKRTGMRLFDDGELADWDRFADEDEGINHRYG